MQWSDFQNLFYLKNQKETLEIVTLKLREWNPHIPEGQPCILLKAVCRFFQSYSFVKRSLQMKTIYSYISYILHFRDHFSSICNKNENLSFFIFTKYRYCDEPGPGCPPYSTSQYFCWSWFHLDYYFLA